MQKKKNECKFSMWEAFVPFLALHGLPSILYLEQGMAPKYHQYGSNSFYQVNKQ